MNDLEGFVGDPVVLTALDKSYSVRIWNGDGDQAWKERVHGPEIHLPTDLDPGFYRMEIQHRVRRKNA